VEVSKTETEKNFVRENLLDIVLVPILVGIAIGLVAVVD